jgi:RND family efflux transporter MFP subunit
MSTFKYFFKLLTLILIAGTVVSCGKKPPEEKKPQIVFVTKIHNGNTVYERRFTGSITPRVESELSFRVGGKIISRKVDVGQHVKQGQLIAELDSRDYQLAVSSATNQHRAADIEAGQAISDAERFKRLSADGSMAKADLERQQAKSDALNEKAKQASEQLELARNRVGYTRLVAPYDGVVTAIRFEAGQVVSDGQGVLTFAKNDELEVTVDVPEGMANALLDYNVEADFPEIGVHKTMLTLRELSPSANMITKTFRARYKFKDKISSVRIGMTADLRMSNLKHESSVELPLSAILSTSKTPQVWTVDEASGSLSLKKVNVIKLGTDTVSVTGLPDEALVVNVGAQKLDQNIKVRPVDRPLKNLTEDK